MPTRRKLIQFGKGSYVISVPKEWIERNKLSKGSEIDMAQSSNQIVISPNKPTEEEVKVKKLSCDNDGRSIGRRIVAAYINNYQIIEISGSTLKDHIKEIEDTTHSLVALEIMEQTPKKVIIKDFLNTQDISVDNIIKRMDIINRAMISDVQALIKKEDKFDLDKRDIDINRLFYVGQKLLNKVLDNPSLSKQLNISLKDVLFYFKVIDALEKIADQQKRIARTILTIPEECISSKKLGELFEVLSSEYLSVVKALYQLDKDEADRVLSKKGSVLERFDGLTINYCGKCKQKDHERQLHQIAEGLEKFKRFENYVTQLAKAIINKD